MPDRIDYGFETWTDKFKRKFNENPWVPIGMWFPEVIRWIIHITKHILLNRLCSDDRRSRHVCTQDESWQVQRYAILASCACRTSGPNASRPRSGFNGYPSIEKITDRRQWCLLFLLSLSPLIHLQPRAYHGTKLSPNSCGNKRRKGGKSNLKRDSKVQNWHMPKSKLLLHEGPPPQKVLEPLRA